MRDLEPPHGRSRGLLVGLGFFSQFALEPLDLRPGLFQPPRESEPLGIAAAVKRGRGASAKSRKRVANERVVQGKT